jgi:hypothetical protein
VEEVENSGDSLVLRAQKIPFITHPYEWCFAQLKEASLLTLSIQETAIKFGMQLKDASAYNVQFIGSKPVFIDTLSFEPISRSVPWVAYKQFCQHFLAPLTVCSFCDSRMKSLFSSYIDGIPLDLAKSLIPYTAYLQPGRFLHLWLHERIQSSRSNRGVERRKGGEGVSSNAAALGLVSSLRSSINGLSKKKEKSVWNAYYKGDSYSQESFEEKRKIVLNILSQINTTMLWDLGANDGFFTEAASQYSKYSVAMDFDVACVENLYLRLCKRGNQTILPLHVDLANPSPGIGWAGKERKSLLDRSPCDTALALALVHHLLVTAHIPLDRLVEFFANICTHLIIEYVPPEDPKFQLLTQTNPNDFSFFTEQKFVSEFEKRFCVKERCKIKDSARVIYHFQNPVDAHE